MKEIIKFLRAMPKSYSMAKRCKGERCLNVFETNIWRFYKMEIEPKLKD